MKKVNFTCPNQKVAGWIAGADEPVDDVDEASEDDDQEAEKDTATVTIAPDTQ